MPIKMLGKSLPPGSGILELLLRVASHLACAAAVSLALLLPAWIFHFFSSVRLTWFSSKYFWIFFSFGIVLAACRSFKVILATLALLGLLEITQFGSLAYQGDFINPYTIGQMFIEMADVAEAAAAGFSHLYWVPLVVLVPYSLLALVLWFLRRRLLKSRWAAVGVILFLLFPAIRIHTHSDRKDILKFFPVVTTPTLANTLNSYSVWATVLLPQSLTDGKSADFKPYRLKEIGLPRSGMSVILVMGESFTFRRMSLYGYERQTTPFLDKLASEGKLIAQKGISAANATRSTMPMFYNLQYNPLNSEVLKAQEANLFRLAKKHGFRTIYISAQKANCLNGVQTSFIDTMITYDTASEIFDRFHDEGLLRLLKNVTFADRNFIVLHQRNIHAPYARNYAHRPQIARFPTKNLDFKTANGNAYDNAVLYNDFLYSQLLEYIESKFEPPVYLFFTSDHSELFGQHGLFGHDHLVLESYMVPIMFYGLGAENSFVERFKKLRWPTHYELGKLIANRLGFRIDNPNEKPGYFYANGVSSLGRSGYLYCRKSGGRQAPEVIEVHH